MIMLVVLVEWPASSRKEGSCQVATTLMLLVKPAEKADPLKRDASKISRLLLLMDLIGILSDIRGICDDANAL
jgi:hypothetical protein